MARPESVHDRNARNAAAWSPNAWTAARRAAVPDAELPRVDAAAYLRGDAGALPRLAAALRDALSGPGVFHLTGTGVDAGPVVDLAHRFHALPEAVKRRYDILHHPMRLGYAPLGGEYQVTSHRATKNRQGYYRATVSGPRLGFDENNWPSEADCPGFRGALEAHMGRMRRLCNELLPAIAAALDSSPGELARLCDERNEVCTLVVYPPAPAEAGMYGVNPHVDGGIFLALIAQDAAGLVIDVEGSGAADAGAAWRRVPRLPDRDAYVVSAGDMMRRASNGRFKAVRHYVDNPPPGRPARAAVPFFLQPSRAVPVAPLSGTVSAARPALFSPLSMEDFYAGSSGTTVASTLKASL